MAEHRAKSLNALLPISLATGYSEIDPELEPLKVHIDPLHCEWLYLISSTELRFRPDRAVR